VEPEFLVSAKTYCPALLMGMSHEGTEKERLLSHSRLSYTHGILNLLLLLNSVRE